MAFSFWEKTLSSICGEKRRKDDVFVKRNDSRFSLLFGDQYNFITGGISILLGVIIMNNVPWLVGKIIGKYGEGVEE